MLSKIEITGRIVAKSGMHIGDSDAFAAIGAIDSPVVRDALTGLPYIPGSSLKGKLRSLLAKAYNDGPSRRDDDDIRIKRMFGSSSSDKETALPSRLIFTDSVLMNMDELKEKGLQSPTEAKWENTINPVTCIANPRNIERVVKGSVFPLRIIYNMINEEEFMEDMEILSNGFKYLQYDYIGGHGSRGYGEIEFVDLDASCVIGDISDEKMEMCCNILKEGN